MNRIRPSIIHLFTATTPRVMRLWSWCRFVAMIYGFYVLYGFVAQKLAM